MVQRELTDERWKRIDPFLPEKKKSPKGGPTPKPKRDCFEGILWVLRVGARWRDLPAEYPNGSTCWRRLRLWEEQGVWLRAWQALLAQLDERKLLDWDEAFLDATFVLAKKGAPRSERPVAGKVRSAWWWSTAGAYLSERNSRPRKFPSSGSRKAR